MFFSPHPASVSYVTKASCKGCLVSVRIIQRLVRDVVCFTGRKGSLRMGRLLGKEWQGGKLVTRPTGLEPGNYDTEESRGTSKKQDHKVTLGAIYIVYLRL